MIKAGLLRAGSILKQTVDIPGAVYWDDNKPFPSHAGDFYIALADQPIMVFKDWKSDSWIRLCHISGRKMTVNQDWVYTYLELVDD